MGFRGDAGPVARLLEPGWSGVYDPGPVLLRRHGRRSDADREPLYRKCNRGRGAYPAKRVLTGSLRYQYMKRWWWHLTSGGRPAVHLQEFIGAARYLLHRMRRSLS